MSDSEVKQLVDDINKYGAMFDDLCIQRHQKGQQEYGELTFLGNDVVRMMMEELADTANYCRYQFVKLMFLQEQLEEQLPDMGLESSGEDLQIGFQSFKGVGETGWGKQQ